MTDWDEIAVLYGRGATKGIVLISGAVGLGWTQWSEPPANSFVNQRVVRSVSIPVEAQLSIAPLRFLGLGIYAAGSVSPHGFDWGLILNAQLGALRPIVSP